MLKALSFLKKEGVSKVSIQIQKKQSRNNDVPVRRMTPLCHYIWTTYDFVWIRIKIGPPPTETTIRNDVMVANTHQ